MWKQRSLDTLEPDVRFPIAVAALSIFGFGAIIKLLTGESLEAHRVADFMFSLCKNQPPDVNRNVVDEQLPPAVYDFAAELGGVLQDKTRAFREQTLTRSEQRSGRVK